MHAVRIGYAVAVVAARERGQDRAGVFEAQNELVAVVADGAGGTGNGGAAAEAIVDAVGARTGRSQDWCSLLEDLDGDGRRLGHGQSTAVVVSICAGVLSGASVGDSSAWLIQGTNVVDLTEGQTRKPLVGAGCVPWPIHPTRFDGTLVVASDGLTRYATRTDIVRTASNADLHAAARALIELVRLPNRTLQDDVAVVLCRSYS